MKKQNKAELARLRAAVPKPPDFMVVKHFEGEPEPQEPAGYKGTFVVLDMSCTRAEHNNPEAALETATQAKLGSSRNMETIQ